MPIARTTGLLRRPGTLWRTPQVLNPAPDPVLRAPVFTPQRVLSVTGGLFLAANLLTSTLSAPAQAAPFVPPDWSAKRQAWRPAEQPQQNLLLTTLSAPVAAAPFVPYDWSLKPVAARLSGAWASSTLPLFQTDPFPFAFDDWQTPTRAKPAADWQAPNLLASTLAAPPIRFTDWSGARASARSYALEPQNLLLTTLAVTVQPAPFIPQEWAAQRLPSRAQGFDPQNLLLTTLAPVAPSVLPFAQYNWPLPAPARRVDGSWASSTMPLYAYELAPFSISFSGTTGAASARGAFDPPNLLTSTLAVSVQVAPFTPYHWAAQSARAWQPGSWASTTLPLFATVFDVLPFAQYDWKLPYERGPVVIPVSQGTPIALLLPPEPPVVEPEHPYPQPAGKSRGRPQKLRRYELPNGMHVFATAREVQALAQSLVDEPIVVRRTKPVYKVKVRVADGAKAQARAVFPVERLGEAGEAGKAQDAIYVDVTQSAPEQDIRLDAVVALIAQRALRRRKIAMLLLMS